MPKQTIIYSLVAATQDGLVKDEYNAVTDVAIRIGLTKDDVKDCMQIIKLERQLAIKLKQCINPWCKGWFWLACLQYNTF